MSYENILYEAADGVGTITLNRPETYNALTSALMDEMKDVLKQISRDKGVRSVILTGAGKGFCSGADLGQNFEVSITDVLRTGTNPLILQMRALEKPIICAVNGVAAGAGTSLALAADYRIAVENASFVFAAFVSIGLVPDAGATYLLTQLVGAGKALELSWLADAKNRLGAQEALQLGVVNRIAAGDLMAEAREVAAKLAQMPTKAIGMTKRAVYRASERTLAEALDYEAQLQGATFKTHDFKEGVAAFLEKREPVFTGE